MTHTLLGPGKTYQVFLTEYGNKGGLYVSSRRAGQFSVQARRTRVKGSFGYRVVVKRTDLAIKTAAFLGPVQPRGEGPLRVEAPARCGHEHRPAPVRVLAWL